MYSKKFLEQLKNGLEQWDEKASKYRPKKSMPRFFTVSGVDIDELYTPDSIKNSERDNYFDENINYPGQFPYTRGVHHTLYRSRLWTMRQFAGMGTPKQTNERFKLILKEGGGGLSTAFDLPTLMGYDSDHSRSLGEVGKCGVAVDTLADMEIIFGDIDLASVSTSMTINSPASMLLAMYLCVAEKQGVPFEKIRGTLQNDILKEYIAQKEFIFPPKPSIRLITDMMDYCCRKVPQWNTISISGYHIREAGATAVQELAFTLADGFCYVESAIAVGMDVDDFAPRLSHFFNAHSDFFEEIAKYRAARRIWARHMRDKYGAKDERSWKLRFHTQTAGCSLTAQQPEINIARVALQALSGVLGGTQSLHTNSMDETLALPSEKAVTIALRTQQIIAYESGAANTVDPLGGSWFVEALTDKMEEEAEAYFAEIERRGGVLQCIEDGYFQRELARSAYSYQQEIEKNDRKVVGVNDFIIENEKIDIPVLRIDRNVEKEQVEFCKKIKAERDNGAVQKTLENLRKVALSDGNTFEAIMDCSRVYVSVGEMCDVLRDTWGEYVETSAAMGVSLERFMSIDFDKTCFVIMPFGKKGTIDRKKYDNTFEHIIKKGIKKSGIGLNCVRVDEKKASTSIVEDIIESVMKAKFVIADLSGNNPNVMYELGVRHSQSRDTILIAEKGSNLPFDIDKIRTIFYSKDTIEEREQAITDISEFLLEMNNDLHPGYSPVLDYNKKYSLEKKDNRTFKERLDSSFILSNIELIEDFENDHFNLYKFEEPSNNILYFVYKDYDFELNSTKLFEDFKLGLKSLLKIFPDLNTNYNKVRFLITSTKVIRKEDKLLELLSGIYSDTIPSGLVNRVLHEISNYNIEDKTAKILLFDIVNLEDYEKSFMIS